MDSLAIYFGKTALSKAVNLQTDMIAGPRATASRELRQVRKEATAAAPVVCRGQARLSYASASGGNLL